jgi:RNA polymerase sigma-70 factor (ECF subfamily)
VVLEGMDGDDQEPRVPVLEHRAGESRFADLVGRMTGGLHAVAYRVLGDHGLSEEVVQDTFAKLAGEDVLARPDGEVAAWLRRVTLNAALNRARTERRARDRLERAGRLEAVPAGAEDTPLAAVLVAEERARVRATLLALPERQRAVLVLRACGYSYAEIAATLEIATGSVGVLLARGERAFRQAYAPRTPSLADEGDDR